MKILHLTTLMFIMSGCQDRIQYSVLPKFKKNIIPEVSSTVESVTNDQGQIRPASIDGSMKYGARILDATCGKEVHNLGVQDEPEFSLPPDVYAKPLCLETTYFDAKGSVIDVKLQPFTFVGPPPVDLTIVVENQVVDLADVPDAVTYAYVIAGRDGLPRAFDSNIRESFLDLKNVLTVGNYQLIVFAQGADGGNLKVITYNLSVILGSTPAAVSYNLRFERTQYQTRSIKRILIDQNLFNDVLGLKIADTAMNTSRIPSYVGGYAAFLDSDDAFMRNSLVYGATSIAIVPIGLTETALDVPVVVKDFTIFRLMPAAFADGNYAKGGLEGWTSSTQQVSVKSGDHEMATEFGTMILQ